MGQLLKLFIMRDTIIELYNYDVSAGTKTFDPITLPKCKAITLQIVCSDMSDGDSTIEVFQSNDGNHWDNIGTTGSTAKIVLPKTTGEGSGTISIIDLYANYIKLVYTKVTDTAGTIKYVHILTS